MGRRHLLAFLCVLVACVGCDQAVKQVAVSCLEGSHGVALVGGALRFELAHNPGAFLGLGQGLPEVVRSVLLMGVVPLLLVLLCAALLRLPALPRGAAVALGLLAGGGLGNWIDRVANDGHVIDFVSLGLGPLRTGIFNVADLAVIGGALLLFVWTRRAAAGPEDGPGSA